MDSDEKPTGSIAMEAGGALRFTESAKRPPEDGLDPGDKHVSVVAGGEAASKETPSSTVTVEDDGILRLTDAEIRHLGGIEPGDRFQFEVIDDYSFRFRKLRS